MKIKLLSSAPDDLSEGRSFYEKQGGGLGEFLYGGIHPKSERTSRGT